MAKQFESGTREYAAPQPDVLLAELQQFSTLRALTEADLLNLNGIERTELKKGAVLLAPGEPVTKFYALLDGEISIDKQDGKDDIHLMTLHAGETFGEVPLLLGWRTIAAHCTATLPSRLLSISTDGFWKMMAHSHATREAVLADHSRRFEVYQAQTIHREKLISLGTLAAGLMHELNNPGAAARRAAAQLRENMTRLQQLSLRMTRASLGPEQLNCLADLQEQVFQLQKPANLSAIEQSDREEELSTWLEELQVENPWRLAPTLVGAGWTHADIACAQESFPPGILSDALNYIDALISSMGHVGTIEESIARVTDLVTAVKKYAYDDKNRQQRIDVRDSLQSTLTILNHKFREKNIQVHRELPSAEVKISCMGVGLTQVWTNLLDNAVDASPENGTVHVRLWTDGEWICVGIRDDGPGIAPEHWEHIFEPFYTTKEAGVGTGLGLDIVQRIVAGSFHGDIRFTTEPGSTEFVVRLPMEQPGAEAGGCHIAAPVDKAKSRSFDFAQDDTVL